MDDDFTEPTYEVTIRVPADGPIPTESDILRALEALRPEFPEMRPSVNRI